MTTTIFTIATIAIPLILAIAIVALCVATYNELVSLKNKTDNGFSQISVQLQRRHDLIPSLVECVKAYMAHERETLESVIAARNTALANLKNAQANPTDKTALAAVGHSEGLLAGVLGNMCIVMEDYPELNANDNVTTLMEQLTSTENRIEFARQSYNDWVTAFNTYRQSFPTCLLAGLLKFKEDATLLEFENAEAIKQAPKIQLV